MLSQDFVCGFTFDLCATNYYTELTTEDYRSSKLTGKPNDINTVNNAYLDSLYTLSNPKLNPPTFRILWMSDLDIDLNYKVGSSTKCFDYSCCHDGIPAANPAEAAPLYGDQKCNMPLEGFKKMMSTINALNTTNYLSFTSFIFGGSATAYTPEFVT